MNKFYIVATPIGNLSEVSKRAIEVFEKTTTFFCEDTRMTKKLLKSLEINYSEKKFFICNNYNDNMDQSVIQKALKVGHCSLVSDAGYPLISDPGYGVWKVLNILRVTPEVINGPTAICHALILSGLPTNNFYFHGFLSTNNATKQLQIEKISKIETTIIIYEGVHKIIKTLEHLKTFFGDIEVCVVKELTKMNETKYKGIISSVIPQIDLRGEFVILFENKISNKMTDTQLIEEINKLVKSGTRKKDACKIIAYKYNLKSNDLFKMIGE